MAQVPLLKLPKKPTVKDGELVSDRVKTKFYTGIEHGKLLEVLAIVVHQTGAATANSTFSNYEDGGNGAHFLIDQNGAIYQTAHLDKQCHHIGQISSRCYKAVNCAPDDLKEIRKIMFNQGDKYWAKKMQKHESEKDYPDRFPLNSEALGVEIVGKYVEGKGFDPVTEAQNASLGWLVGVLDDLYGLTGDDTYRHGEIGRKQPDEAKTASW